jgi:uncharacterized membrane protein
LERESVTAALQALLVLSYPLVVYVALGFASPRAVALVTLGLVAARALFAAREKLWTFARLLAPLGLAFALPSLVSLVWNDPVSLLLAPALFNAAMLAVFAASFAARETTVETLARAQVGSLSEAERVYCRRVTALWCGFFAANGAACAWVALFGSRAEWALYTGVVAYALLGALFAAEYVYRHWRFRRYHGAPTDALLRRLFPPRPD